MASLLKKTKIKQQHKTKAKQKQKMREKIIHFKEQS